MLCYFCDWNIFFAILYNSNTYGGYEYSCYFCNRNKINGALIQSCMFPLRRSGARRWPPVVLRFFFAFLFSDPDFGVRSFKDVGLITSSIVCCKCGSQMFLRVSSHRRDGYRWWCRSIKSTYAFSASTSIRNGFIEVLFITYDIVLRFLLTLFHKDIRSAPHLPNVTVILQHDSSSLHSTHLCRHRPQHVCLWSGHQLGWRISSFVVRRTPQVAKRTNYHTTSERCATKIQQVIRGMGKRSS